MKLKPARNAPDAGLRAASQSATSPRRRRLRIWLVWLFLTCFCGFFDRADVRGFGFSYFDNYFYGVQMGLATERNSHLAAWARQQIVIVPISDDTFDPNNADLLEGPPVSRAAHARVLRDLKAAGARAVVFDIVFKVKGANKKADDALIEAAKMPGAPALWACLVENEDARARLVLPMAPLVKASPHYGHILSPQDGESLVVKRVPTVSEIGGRAIPALSVQAALLASGAKKTTPQRSGSGWQIGDLQLPEIFSIQYVARANGEENDGQNAFASVPFEQLANGAAQDPFYRDFFKNKIVVIGDTTKVGNDFRFTPVGFMPGVEIQANAIASVLLAQSGKHPLARDVSPPVSLLIIAVLTGLTCGIAARFSLARGALTVVFLAMAFVVGQSWLFVDYGWITHTFGPLMALVLAASFVFFERGFWEEREKNYVRGLLGRYVSPAVADFILKNPERCALGGEEVRATVLFADIRGFTAISEQLPARTTLRLLNEYFEAMSDVVFAHDGTVDKFIGDAIMAIFGAPVETKNHASQAILTAIEMQNRLQNLREKWRNEGLPELHIGIGVATGTMIVGNMGSRTRTDFSVIGDAVNLASRLQDLNKRFDTSILISDATERDWSAGPNFLPPNAQIEDAQTVQIRGHAQMETVHAISW